MQKIQEFLKQNFHFILLIFTFIVWILFLKNSLGISTFLIYSISISSIVIFVLSKIKMPNYIFGWISIFITILNLFFVILSLIPTYSNKVDTTWFYEEQKNYVKVEILDSEEELSKNNAKLWIKNDNKTDLKRERNLTDPSLKDKEIEVFSGDSIYYISKTKNLNTMINLYLWDGSIIRILPMTTINIDQIIKDTKDLVSSKTSIKLEKWWIWFKVIKTIKWDDSFNIKTNEWTIVIRWTAWLSYFDIQNSETTVYSNDHIIELKTIWWESKYINKNQTAKLTKTSIENVNLSDFQKTIWENIYKKISSNEFLHLDENDVADYQDSLKNYIIENFGWALYGKWNFEYLWELKLRIFSQIDKEYWGKLDNFKKFKLMTSDDNYLTDETLTDKEKSKISETKLNAIKELLKTDNIKDAIFTPINEETQTLKFKYLENMAFNWFDDIKTFIITAFNKMIDNWMEIPEDKIMQSLENAKTNINQTYNDIIKQIQK